MLDSEKSDLLRPGEQPPVPLRPSNMGIPVVVASGEVGVAPVEVRRESEATHSRGDSAGGDVLAPCVHGSPAIDVDAG